MSEGISRGFVRPLSRVTYAPHDAARAFRLLEASRHRGRVLLRMCDTLKQVQSRLTSNPDRGHLILCNGNTFGLQLADRLVERGVKKLHIHYRKQSTYLQVKIRSWQISGCQVSVLTDSLFEERDVTAMLNNVINHGLLEGIYVTAGDIQQDILENLLRNLDSVSKKLCPDLKYFAVLNMGANTIGKEVCLDRVRNQLPATMVTLPELSLESNSEGALYRAALEVTEKALRGGHAVVLAHSAPTRQHTLLQKIAELADVTILDITSNDKTLNELGMENDKIKIIRNFLRLHYNLVFEENEIPSLTVDKLQKFENTITKSDFEDGKGLSIFFSCVDSDELLSTTDMVFLPTIVNNAQMRDDEFDADQNYLCIVPGMEGHYERFRVLCERLKLPALVLQPGLDRPHETVLEMAERFAEILLKKTGLKNNFYLLGYESGVSIALEIAAILEDNGLTGTIYCIGYGPEDFKLFLERHLSEFESEEQLQNAVVRHMFELMAGCDKTVPLENALRAENTWSQKVDACVRALLGRVPHSTQYARGLIEAALGRIQRAREYMPRVRALRSQLVLLHPAPAHASSAPLGLQRHSQRPVAVHQLRAPLAHASRDLNCAAIVNAYLEPEILVNFDKKNICETYLLNADSFVSLEQKDKV